jgi:hypothetical protein
MRNLYGITSTQKAVIVWLERCATPSSTCRPSPGSFPDYSAPIVRTAADGAR